MGTDSGERIPCLIVVKEGKVIEKACLDGQSTFVMGRHANCDIVVSHASISRHHLEIRIVPDPPQFLITDLQSVHGSKLNGEQLQPFHPAVVEKQDAFQIGASTRLYKLRWLPPQANNSERSDSCSSKLEAASSKKENSQGCHGSNLNSKLKDFSQVEQENVHSRNQSPLIPLINQRDEDVAYKSRSPLKGMKEIPTARRSALSLISGSSPGSAAGSRRLTIESPSLRKPSLASPARKLLLADPPLMMMNCADQSPLYKNLSSLARENEKLTPRKVKPPGGEQQTPASLWLRRCNSTPLPQLVTASLPSHARPLQKLPIFSEAEETQDHNKVSLARDNADDESEYYPSDKENVAPARKTPSKKQEDRKSLLQQERQPFQPLVVPSPVSQSGSYSYRPVFQPASCTSSEEDSLKALGLPKHLRQSILAETMDQMMRKLKVSDSGDPHTKWHIIVDTNCLLEVESLNALKQLEGIRETRIIIPKIVVRELDFMKRRENLRNGARAALKWIEDCMVKLPSWIHVQSSSETRPVGITPPVSPALSLQNFSQYGSAIDLLSPTNDDHILDCALLFANSVSDGQVVLLTKDTALKIKAMAEGLLSENATKFCECLINPYSDRFLWAGSSTALRPVWSDKSGLRNKSSSSIISNSNNTSESGRKGMMMMVPSDAAARRQSSHQKQSCDSLLHHHHHHEQTKSLQSVI
ncbi:hypothetical protein O6H91_22G010000 [Diphasiastrum complanatum]|uniref:Uncharacterized protein n=1 Tax=Diphasiastrum complanatum TaxID=34168 RepID=A0ACC2ACN5_DIPCM|nr:hypothetical protein O6H91_Y552900 [Diphasiastrum complanatum]KAJ7515307.1 hypothetical protein O6H91_22G010000 [Diphasiastrum complanatum]